MGYKLTYKTFGERSVLIEWPPMIDESVLLDILTFKSKITTKKIKSIANINSAYNSLLISFNSIEADFKSEVALLKKMYSSKKHVKKLKRRIWKVPVCYDTTFGIDLNEIALAKGITKHELIKRHTQGVYSVYFIGFLPGFLYLGGLDETLSMPRKDTPRLQVDKGAVAIGGNQTGVYPNESPGGWNIIGNSPVLFFDATKESPCFAKAGDIIQFYEISKDIYDDIKILADEGVYQLESEELHD